MEMSEKRDHSTKEERLLMQFHGWIGDCISEYMYRGPIIISISISMTKAEISLLMLKKRKSFQGNRSKLGLQMKGRMKQIVAVIVMEALVKEDRLEEIKGISSNLNINNFIHYTRLVGLLFRNFYE
jgi:hypothetical protein